MYETVVGIEVHVELKSNSKVFSHSQNEYSTEPNLYVNEIDLGYPGVLPVLNKKVIEMALQASLALNCKINKVMHFDRKNYFYPDLPKGYQITEQDTPIGYDGYIDIGDKKIGIERLHIEEDTCKSIHGKRGTMLDANRAGVPLIEIVSKPDMRSPEDAVKYLTKLREILLYLGISDVKIEEGSMRCDCNVSIHKPGTPLGTKIEIKNIGSINNVGEAIKYEIKRQSEILDNGDKIEHEETRRLDDKTMTTILMRVKETGNDYRYFPEPDIPYVELSDDWINDVKANMPVFADELKEKYKNLGINDNNIKTIIGRLDLCQFLESVIDSVDPVTASNLLTGDILSYLNKNYVSINKIKLNKDNFSELVNDITGGKISSKQAKELVPYLIENGGSVKDAVDTLGLNEITDTNALNDIVKRVLDSNPESIKDYNDGKDRAIKYLMGQIMKETGGKANPAIASQILMSLIKDYKL
ncbi:MAG: Asp-tRNA(Asn)/Glu-tRNA(Gln) amidotransferase subunit GatB [Bacilli bacterium]|nr:Asp-tRNA(Asn)/Glu-tRNA(Gln) amidotransferase subunit GatB [Bacilli bacterium]